MRKHYPIEILDSDEGSGREHTDHEGISFSSELKVVDSFSVRYETVGSIKSA